MGVIPAFSQWLGFISFGTGVALLCVGAAVLMGAFRICLMISRLVIQNQELAMTVSLLLAEQREDREENAGGSRDHEESLVCH